MCKKPKVVISMIFLLVCLVVLSGCAPLWFAGGAAAGVAVAKDAEDGKVIDN